MNLHGHLHTVRPLLFQGAKFQIEPETLTLNDGDFLRVYRLAEHHLDPAKTVLLIHGMMGNKDSPVVVKIARQLLGQGYSPIIVEMRNCSSVPNNTPKFFHAGSVDDLSNTIEYICGQIGCRLSHVMGFSLGANVLMQWSAVYPGVAQWVERISCICLPLDLHQTAVAANTGLSRVYQRSMLKRYRKALLRKSDSATLNLNALIHSIDSMLEFDDKITASLNGYKDRIDYYQQNSALQYLGHNQVPCSILNSANDPLIPNSWQALEKFKHHGNLDINILNHGGHLGLLHVNKPTPLGIESDTLTSSHYE